MGAPEESVEEADEEEEELHWQRLLGDQPSAPGEGPDDPCEEHHYDRTSCEQKGGCVYEIATDSCYAGVPLACELGNGGAGQPFYAIDCGDGTIPAQAMGWTPNCYCEYFVDAMSFAARDGDEELVCTMLEDPDNPEDDGCCGVQTCNNGESVDLDVDGVVDSDGEPNLNGGFGQYLVKQVHEEDDATDETKFGQNFQRIVTINETHRPKITKKITREKVKNSKTGKIARVTTLQERQIEAETDKLQCRMKYFVNDLGLNKDLPAGVQAQINDDGSFHGSWRPCHQKLHKPSK